MRVAVTGAHGYIGSALCRRLELQREVEAIRALVRRADRTASRWNDGVEIVTGDVRDPAVLKRLVDGADVVVHAAAKVGRGDWAQFLSTNVDAVRELSLAAARAGVAKVILLSSIEVYGRIRGDVDETRAPQLCGHSYADSKVLGERELWTALRGTSTGGVVVRPGMVFGPESPFWTMRIIRLAQRGELEVYGGGQGNAMPVFIDDLIDALLLCVRKPDACGRAFNFANLEDVTWRRWYSDYCAMIRDGRFRSKSIVAARLREVARVAFGRPGSRHLEVMTRTGRIISKRALDVLGWVPRVGYEAGMRRTQDWLHDKGWD